MRQLSSDEAKILKYLSIHGFDYPLIDLHYILDDGNGYLVDLYNFTDIGYGLIEKPELISAYLSNLSRFGIIEIETGVYLNEDSLYKNLEAHNYVQNQKLKIKNKPGKYEIKKKKFIITDYGKAFLKSCVVDKNNGD